MATEQSSSGPEPDKDKEAKIAAGNKLQEKLDDDESSLADDTLLKLNDEIEKTFKGYFKDSTIQLRFDIPDKDDPPNDPTLCVFLYDIQEDLELRHGQPRAYDVATQQFAPGQTHVRCCYLITYWESKNVPETRMGPRSQSMVVMNLVLNALLNLKLETVKPTFKRVIAPSEHLSSLGNFWQALGNKPRLCLNFAVTVPISLAAQKETVVLVKVPDTKVESLNGRDAGSVAQTVAQQLREVLITKLRDAAKGDAALTPDRLRAQLDKLTVTCTTDEKNTLNAAGPWDVAVSGVLDTKLHVAAVDEVNAWKSNSPIEKTKVAKVDSAELLDVAKIGK